MTNTNNGIPVGIGYDSKNNAKSLMEIDSIQVSQVSATTYLNIQHPAGGGGGVTTLSGLGDVCNDVAVAGRPLVWDAVTSKWCGSAIDLHQISVNTNTIQGVSDQAAANLTSVNTLVLGAGSLALSIAAGDASTVALSGYVSTNESEWVNTVTTVNTQTPTAGNITLTTDNISDEGSTNKFVTAGNLTTLGNNTTEIATNAAGITYLSSVVIEEIYASSTGLSAAIDGKQTFDVSLNEIAAISYLEGDILYANSEGALVALPEGTDGATLTLQLGVPTWVPSALG
tara:strand:- start:1795 stop:2649 length:855 start_codon:yes stop_codon:yes gene_type:complete